MLRIGAEQDPAPTQELAVELPQRGPLGPSLLWFYGSAILLHEQLYPRPTSCLNGADQGPSLESVTVTPETNWGPGSNGRVL